MIHCLTGRILKKSPEQVVLSCAGVGYQVQVPPSVAGALPAVGREGTLYTHLNITENDISLYGFATEEQQACFRMMISVSGVGPKVGLSILGVMTPERIALAASAGNYKAFTAANGVGNKLAQRLALELKDKVGKGLAGGPGLEELPGAASPAGAAAQAMAALVSLGYSQSEAALAVAKLDETLPVEELVKLALRSMAGRR